MVYHFRYTANELRIFNKEKPLKLNFQGLSYFSWF